MPTPRHDAYMAPHAREVMKSITVFQFKRYSVEARAFVMSHRWATLKAIVAANGTPIMESGKDVPALEVDGNGFHPRGAL